MDNIIIKAAQFAELIHRTHEPRKFTLRPYIEHPSRVAARVMTIPGVDEDVVCAAWMHDILEDHPGVEIPAIFNPRCYRMVLALTNPSKDHPELNRDDRKAMDRDHLRNCDPWVKIVKLVDRIDNLRDLQNCSDGFEYRYAKESLLLCAVLRSYCNSTIDALCDELDALCNEIIATFRT